MNRPKTGTAIAAVVAGTVALFPALEAGAAGRLAVAHSVHRWRDPCPAVDGEPICNTEWRLDDSSSGSAGTKVVVRTAPTEIPPLERATPPNIYDPDYGPVAHVDDTTDWIDGIGTDCRRVPWPEIVACPE
jgi:hypothetical protein